MPGICEARIEKTMFWECLLGHWLESSGKARSSPPCVLWLWSRNAGFSEGIGKAACAPAPTLTSVGWSAGGEQPLVPSHTRTLFPTQSLPGVQGLLGSIWGTFLGHNMAVTEVQRGFRLFWPAVLTGNTVEGKIKTRREQVRFSQARVSLPWIGADRRMGGSSLWGLLERQASINNLVYVIPRHC